ncbi:hypothetical protein EJ05DRAFT_496304 [Pseudovirgaria hyperparasitica]|uniref:COP9 signalosome complex subunit 6 n=1 Tax=Pseudovirgaria hyperparasitica TaxID=470096 RepID=A0A6A6WMP7_9PEZI|nr:uncharacterized protein EJ05DRAFT_496304 [Pseudovirgaria hyperparasitica]KAF2763484.1 hypothetical protein EJ05DRAFT_496304 [Pseudovirgaria hyperparasitica]
MAETEVNPLLSTARATDTSPTVQLHPLVLLNISDYLTRHTLRKLNVPIIGAILGQQNGREVTMEVAFECKVLDQGDQWIVDDDWFRTRLEQYKDVYKVPALDFVGWYSIGQTTGPETHHLLIQEYFQTHNESAIFLLFQPNVVANMASGKLPLALFEPVTEGVGPADVSSMELDGPLTKSLKLRELNYTVETGEAEMISVDFVARGGGNATAIDGTKPQQVEKSPNEADSSTKGKGRAKTDETPTSYTTEEYNLSAEDEELSSSIIAKSNAIRMLHKRINLIQKILAKTPTSYLTDSTQPIIANAPSQTQDQIILRSISALLARLLILAPPDTATFQQESAEAKSDVALTGLLSSMLASVQAAKEMGRKYGVVEGVKQTAQARKGGLAGQSTFMDTMLSEGGSGSGDLYGGSGGGRRGKNTFGEGGYV